jgi:membrane-associated phospholipid phosphatase
MRQSSHDAPAGLRRAVAGFVLLLALALVWPAPAIWLNERTIGAELNVDADAFIGRQPMAWDIAFWTIAGLYVLALLHGRFHDAKVALRVLRRDVACSRGCMSRGWRAIPHSSKWLAAVLSAVAVALVWLFLDAPALRFAELIHADFPRIVVRLANRLGGGANPSMIIIFFLLAGLVFVRVRWAILSLSMIAAGLVGGGLVQLLKLAIGRSRPELWLGPFHHAYGASSSFPSGHTVSAFAIAGVLLVGSRSPWLRAIALILATLVGLSRILAFRHWPSDVLASALIGLLAGWFFTRALLTGCVRREEERLAAPVAELEASR